MSSDKLTKMKNSPIRKRIIATTVKLFNEHGIQSIGIDRIVGESQVAKMTLYKYFPSKDDLIAEYFQVICSNWFEQFETFINKNYLNDYNKLVGSFHYLKLSAQQNQSFRGIPFVNASFELVDSHHFLKGEILEQQEKLRKLFEKWAKNCTLKNPRQLSYSLLAILYGATVSASIEDFPEPFTHGIKTAQDLLDLHRN